MSRRRGKAFRVRSARSSRNLKRYWNDVRAIRTARHLSTADARKAYGKAVAGGLERGETTRRGLLQRVGRLLNLEQKAKKEAEYVAVRKEGFSVIFEPLKPPPVFDMSDPLNKGPLEFAYADAEPKEGEGRASIQVIKPDAEAGSFIEESVSITWEYDVSGGVDAYLRAYYAKVREEFYTGKSPEEGYFAVQLAVR